MVGLTGPGLLTNVATSARVAHRGRFAVELWSGGAAASLEGGTAQRPEGDSSSCRGQSSNANETQSSASETLSNENETQSSENELGVYRQDREAAWGRGRSIAEFEAMAAAVQPKWQGLRRSA